MKKFFCCALLLLSFFSVPTYAYTTGWHKYGTYSGNTYWYYTQNDGSDAKGWQKIDGKWYFFEQQGEGYITVSGWKLLDGKWYYFDNNGVMLSDTMIDGHCLGTNGAWMHNIRWTSTGYCADCGTVTGKGMDGVFLCDNCQAKRLGV